MKTVSISLPVPDAIEYDICIGAGLLADLGRRVHAVAPAPTAGLVTDTHVGPHYRAAAKASLEAAGYRVIAAVIPAGESHKTIHTAVDVLDQFLHAKVERATPIIALGGGVVGDLAGFVAATLLRGVPFVQVPTTLLAAVDASVGGKVGVDHTAGKNLIGAFHQPRLVLTDIATFRTLPERELRCGLAECVKHGIIRDRDLFAFIATNLGKIIAQDEGCMAELVARNVQIKADVVQEDPFEHGVRALLNLGHTFGHAIESVTDYGRYQHGEAVALGIIAAAHVAVCTQRLAEKEFEEITDLLDVIGLPTAFPGIDVEKVFAAMGTDKKVKGGKLRFILPTSIGDAQVVTDVPDALVKQSLEALGEPPMGARCDRD